MAKLPSLTARKVVRALNRAGFVDDRQKGSHLILIHPETKARTVVPFIADGRLRNLFFEPSFETQNYRLTSLFSCFDFGG